VTEKTDPGEGPFRLRGDRYEDDRLAGLMDAMYSFAQQHGMVLKPRYNVDPTWHFLWNDRGVDRHVQLHIGQLHTSVELRISAMAWRDEPSRNRRFVGHPRRYLLIMPVEEDVFLETMEMSRRDALSLEVPSE